MMSALTKVPRKFVNIYYICPYHGQDLLAEKNLSVTLNDINNCSEVGASSYLTL